MALTGTSTTTWVPDRRQMLSAGDGGSMPSWRATSWNCSPAVSGCPVRRRPGRTGRRLGRHAHPPGKHGGAGTPGRNCRLRHPLIMAGSIISAEVASCARSPPGSRTLDRVCDAASGGNRGQSPDGQMASRPIYTAIGVSRSGRRTAGCGFSMETASEDIGLLFPKTGRGTMVELKLDDKMSGPRGNPLLAEVT